MKLSSLIAIGTIFCLAGSSCGNNDFDSYNDEAYGYEQDFNNTYNESEMDNNQMNYQEQNSNARFASNTNGGNNGNNGNVKMHPMKDPKTGALIGYVPLPADWDITGPTWKGPGNTQVQYQNGGLFLDNQRRVSGIDQIIREDILPAIQQQGGRAGNISEHPEIAAFDQRRDAQMVKYGQVQSQFAVKSIEFMDQRGKKGLIIVHFTQTRSQFGSMAGYGMQVMSCNPDYFPRAKAAILYAVGNIQMNQQYVNAMNQAESSKLAASDRAFQSRMAAKQANFDSWMANQRQTSNSILDSGMESWRRRNAMSDAGQANAVHGINGTREVTNPYDGTNWTVDDGYNHTFMNTWGETIQTDDHFYNPNMDPNVNNQSWESVYDDY
ncbi:MAG: hypothetical protein R2879_08950 [Saprospiraceae bacterium]